MSTRRRKTPRTRLQTAATADPASPLSSPPISPADAPSRKRRQTDAARDRLADEVVPVRARARVGELRRPLGGRDPNTTHSSSNISALTASLLDASHAADSDGSDVENSGTRWARTAAKGPKGVLDELVHDLGDAATRCAGADAVAAYMTEHDEWTEARLALLAPSDVRTLAFAATSFRAPAPLWTRPFLNTLGFRSLRKLSIARVPLQNDDVANLRVLGALEELGLVGTGISDESLHHVVCHRHHLRVLDVADNPGLTDDARLALARLGRLERVFLRGTSVTMLTLRTIVATLPNTRIYTIPSECLLYLNTREEHYVVLLPPEYVSSPKLVPSLTLPVLKRNLELHRSVNKHVPVTGTKPEMVQRLQGILNRRLQDERVARAVGKPQTL
ncbi:uncharacterized protein V1510DRAFT_405238 [Dipodascopsis tothii]|uniref:uncharacterized protein n=1 Tax=Dipodascopsis tothii TaxID=44089 RepID=UPI0034CF4359